MTLSFSRGFDSGNYGNAYESQDWDTWYANNCDKVPTDLVREEWEEGAILGFFSSYEIHEIEDDSAAATVGFLREKHGMEP